MRTEPGAHFANLELSTATPATVHSCRSDPLDSSSPSRHKDFASPSFSIPTVPVQVHCHLLLPCPLNPFFTGLPNGDFCSPHLSLGVLMSLLPPLDLKPCPGNCLLLRERPELKSLTFWLHTSSC